jgi:hypothetical protein
MERARSGQKFMDTRMRFWFMAVALSGAFLLGEKPGWAQVSPAEILNPDLKIAESNYFPQLKELNHAIMSATFPFPFFLSRFVGVEPAKQAESDSRGIEFVNFHGRIVLKISGNYYAAYSAQRFTQNERASRTFQDAIAPILQLVSRKISPDVACDAIGFEVSHHVRAMSLDYDYEGKEILVAVFARDDAFAFSRAASEAEKQEIVNRSDVYLNGAPFGLALNGREALDVEAIERSSSQKIPATASVAGASNPAPQSASNLLSRTLRLEAGLSPVVEAPKTPAGASAAPEPEREGSPATAAPAQTDVDRLQAQFQANLDTLAKDGAAKFHLVDYAPPSFAIFHNQIILQITIRNPAHFDLDRSSIYRRAAESFDLFLAPELKDLLEEVPSDFEFQAFDFTVLNQISQEPHSASEAIEYILPRKAVRQFVDADITNQRLMDQGIVLVNAVRIALNLQLVE